MVKVFTVVLNWNGFKDTKECLASLAKVEINDHISHEIIVVDNASTDDSIEQLKKLPFKFELLQTKHNLGFAGGNNFGIRHALHNGADYIFVLNNDTEVDPKVITELLETATKGKKIGLVSPKIYFAKGFEFHKDRYKNSERGKVIWYAGGDIDWNNVYGSNHGVDEVDSGKFNEVMETDFATGAAMFITAKAIRKVGSFDERFYLYLEDTDLSMRMKKKKWKVIYTPSSVVWHKVSQSSGIGSSLNDYFTTRNRLLFGMRYAPLRTRLALFKESIRMMFSGRKWQKIGVMDYYIGNLGKGSWK